MSILVINLEGGLIQSLTSDDDDLQVIVIDRDDDSEPGLIESFYTVNVNPEVVAEVWERVSAAGGRIESDGSVPGCGHPECQRDGGGVVLPCRFPEGAV